MTSRRAASVAPVLLSLLSPFVVAQAASTRDDALRRARVWTPVPVERMDLKAGPDDRRGSPFLAPAPRQSEKKPLRGHSLKFACLLDGGESIKVKVGGSNGE